MLSDRTTKALVGIGKAAQTGCRARKLHKILRTHRDLWLRAYANIYANRGALTEGVNDNTLDGFGEERVDALIAALRDGSYRPSPVRRTYILKDPRKPNGKKRPLGIPTGNDKLVQEVARMLLEEIYEPIFSDRSHGFRPKKSCHTALQQVVESWKGTKWICDVDIKGYFDNIDHATLLRLLEKRIDDPQFLTLIQQFLEAGYLEDWQFNATFSGTPQGGIISPILANVYLHELDEFMERRIEGFNKGRRRRANKAYHRLVNNISNRKKTLRTLQADDPKAVRLQAEIAQMSANMAELPSLDMHDEGFRRLHYVRYADDFLIGVVGTKEDAIRIMEEVKAFVEGDLKLTISEEKTKLGSFEDGTTFLGYGVKTRRMDKRLKCVVAEKADGTKVHATKKTVTSHIHLYVPEAKIRAYSQRKGYGTYDAGRTDIRWRGNMLFQSDYETVSQFNAELRGFANYYCLAPKYYLNRLEWVANISLFKTLARKHDVTWAKVVQRMKTQPGEYVLEYDLKGERRQLPVFKIKNRARWSPPWVDVIPNVYRYVGTTELLDRLSARVCEYCGIEQGPFEVHHIRKMKDVQRGKATWERMMIARQRKTLVLCRPCHIDLHRGTLSDNRFAVHTSRMESRMR